MTRSRLLRALATVAGVIGFTVAVVLTFRDAEARRVVGELTVPAVLLLLALQAFRVLLESLRYRMVVPDRYRSVIPVSTWHWVFAVGRLLNMVVPQMGTAYRATHLRLGHGLPVSSFIGTTFVITWLGNGFATLAAGVIVVTANVTAGLALMVFGAGVVAAVSLLLPRLGEWIRSRGERSGGRLIRLAQGVLDGSTDLRRRRRLALMLFMSILSQVVGLVTYGAVCLALDVEDPWLTAAVLFAALTVASTVSLTPGGLGISEAIAGLTGSLLGLGAGVGVVIALVMRITGTLVVAALAVAAAIAGARRPAITSPSDDR